MILSFRLCSAIFLVSDSIRHRQATAICVTGVSNRKHSDGTSNSVWFEVSGKLFDENLLWLAEYKIPGAFFCNQGKANISKEHKGYAFAI